MRITDIQYTAPTQANPIGGLVFKAEIPVFFKEGETKPVVEGDDVAVQLSEDTMKVLEQLSAAIIKDISTQ